MNRMTAALRSIGYSHHSGLPRYGPKAKLARWGLGLDDLPEDHALVDGKVVPQVEGHRILR